MAKRQDDLSPAEDYVDQLHWRARQGWRSSIRFEPKWKYKIIYRVRRKSFWDRIMNGLFFGGLLFLAFYLLVSDVLTGIEKIFLGGLVGLFVIVFFFAVRDVPRDQDRKNDDIKIL